MSLTDPQSVTVATVTSSLPKTGTGPTSAVYTSADGSLALAISHLYGKRNRRTARLTQTKLITDPIVPAQNTRTSMSVYMVWDTPPLGMTAADQKALSDAFVAFLGATSGAVVTKILGGES